MKNDSSDQQHKRSKRLNLLPLTEINVGGTSGQTATNTGIPTTTSGAGALIAQQQNLLAQQVQSAALRGINLNSKVFGLNTALQSYLGAANNQFDVYDSASKVAIGSGQGAGGTQQA